MRKCIYCGSDIVGRANNAKYCGSKCKRKADNEERVKDGSNFSNYYGITKKEYNMLLESQNNKCAVCSVDGVKLYVDHCHDTMLIRGLICAKCNIGLAQLGDTIDGLLKGLHYLHALPAQNILAGRKAKRNQ